MTYEKDIQRIADHVGADAGALGRLIRDTEFLEKTPDAITVGPEQYEVLEQSSILRPVRSLPAEPIEEDIEFLPFDVIDDRPYASFDVFNHHDGSALPLELVAHSAESDRLLMPVGVKNRYRTTEAALDVCALARKLFIGKNKQEVEKMLGLENMT